MDRAISAISTAITPLPMRYTEARLTDAAIDLMAGWTTERSDYNHLQRRRGRARGLPRPVPQSTGERRGGIAVGMATSIPPHNVAEIIDAALHLIATPDAPKPICCSSCKGPDFPTGGLIVEPPPASPRPMPPGAAVSGARALERRGSGPRHLDAVITEIPYQVQKGKLIERWPNWSPTRSCRSLADVRDESMSSCASSSNPQPQC
jgi:topoisomerase IV subunit A